MVLALSATTNLLMTDRCEILTSKLLGIGFNSLCIFFISKISSFSKKM